MNLLLFFITIIILLLTVPGMIELLVLTVSALYGHFKPKTMDRKQADRGRLLQLALVIPAHNEDDGIAACIQSIKRSIVPHRNCNLVVIADNCSDNTAEIAKAEGARVLARNNQEQRGKGYALNYAFEILLAEGYEGFIIVDADSRIDESLVSEFQRALSLGYDAVQCRYRISNTNTSLRSRMQNIAWLAFNDLRLQGREALGLSVGILGNGFALSRDTLKEVSYDAGSIAEDLEYHLRLVQAGRRVHFLDTVTVYSEAPSQGKAAAVQRSRWEGGRFRMIIEQTPKLLTGVLQGRFLLLEPLAELLLLPLAYHVALLLLALFLPFFWIQLYASLAMMTVVLHIFAAILINGGSWRDVTILAAAPFYILWKLIMLPQILRNASTNASWERTDREIK